MPDIHTLLSAALLGIIEGLTEFLPVSSTAHLLLADRLLGFGSKAGVFEVAIQTGAVTAIILTFWQRLWPMVVQAPTHPDKRHELMVLVIAFMPAMVIGGLLHDFVKHILFENMTVIAAALILGGLAILMIERTARQPKIQALAQMPFQTALWIGLCQCLALVPGVSRSGATIMGALALGVDRKTAAEFSFFLAVPTLAAATALDLYKNFHLLQTEDWQLIGVGFVTAYLSARVVAREFIGFVSRYGFAPFAMYRILLGLFMLWYFN